MVRHDRYRARAKFSIRLRDQIFRCRQYTKSYTICQFGRQEFSEAPKKLGRGNGNLIVVGVVRHIF